MAKIICSLLWIYNIFISNSPHKQLLKYSIIKSYCLYVCLFFLLLRVTTCVPGCLWLLLFRCAVPLRFILPLHMLIRHYSTRKCSYATTSPDAPHTHRRQDHFWILLRCVKILFYVFILQSLFYILAQSLKCFLQFFEYNVDVEVLQSPPLPLSPCFIFPIVLLFEILYNLFGWGTIPEQEHIQRIAIRLLRTLFPSGLFPSNSEWNSHELDPEQDLPEHYDAPQ